MVPLKLSLASFLLLSPWLAAGELPRLEIKNELQQCIAINDRAVIDIREIPILKMKIKILSETGSCGCKSALAKYNVYQMMAGYEAWVMSGEFTPVGREELQLPIAAQIQVIEYAKKIKITISCASLS
ncbi:MAG TPA: DUF2195 family protein [Cellvibrio sp.]|nr:DUF2195 family protein [Cellvibrio sp.]